MDTGLADILGEPKQISHPAIVVFDLKTDKLVRRYELKSSDYKDDSFFANIVSIEAKGDFCTFDISGEIRNFRIVTDGIEKYKTESDMFFLCEPLFYCFLIRCSYQSQMQKRLYTMKVTTWLC